MAGVMSLNTTKCQALINATSGGGVTAQTGITASVEMWEAVLIFVFTGLLASLMAVVFTFFRKSIYHDKDSLDTSFDAGGKVNAGLTASTIVSQWTWAATLLQSSTVAAKYGISGPFWYAAGATIQILLFAMLSVQLKTRAPGAKTFLQVINARFGKTTHKVFCVFALATNVIVTAMLMLGGAAVTTSLVKEISVEYATTLVAAIIGAYTFIGGLGATFYVSYFNAVIIYFVMIIFIAKVYMNPDDPSNPIGSIDRVYDFLSCSIGPSGNKNRSYLTMISDSGLMFGLINIVGNFGTVFVDQSYWQSSVAAKPRQGVLGFLFGGLAWFAIPFSMATTMGLAYIALSTQQAAPLLSSSQIDAGLVPPVVASRLLGRSGELLMLSMILMAVTSTGSAEVIAVTSILVYDIYGIYLRPYRRTTDANSCVLCGKGRGRMANPRDKCTCTSMTYCAHCHKDDKQIELNKRAIRREYKCPMHGAFREYTEYLSGLRNWCLVWTTMAIVPLTVILHMIKLSLGWVYLFMGVLVGSAVIPITLCMFWGRLTGLAMVLGSVGGAVFALITWLAVASTYDGGLRNFMENTGKEMSMLCGNLVAILSGGVITILTSLVTNRHYDKERAGEIWENTRDIDSPLVPWTEIYAKELDLTGTQHLDNRPTLEEVSQTFRTSRWIANAGSVSLALVLVVLWPACMVAIGTMSREEFSSWVNLSKAWAFLALAFVVIVPLVNEATDLVHAFKVGRKVHCGSEEVLVAGGSSHVEPQVRPRVHVSTPTAPATPYRDPTFTTLSAKGEEGLGEGNEKEEEGGESVGVRVVGLGTATTMTTTPEIKRSDSGDITYIQSGRGGNCQEADAVLEARGVLGGDEDAGNGGLAGMRMEGEAWDDSRQSVF